MRARQQTDCLYPSRTVPLPVAATPEPQDNPDQAHLAPGRSTCAKCGWRTMQTRLTQRRRKRFNA